MVKKKDDSGASAVFSAQGSSASQMTAAKVMDVIARLPGCDGQAADAVSDYKQGLFLSEKVDDIKNSWKEADYGSHVGEIDETCVR